MSTKGALGLACGHEYTRNRRLGRLGLGVRLGLRVRFWVQGEQRTSLEYETTGVETQSTRGILVLSTGGLISNMPGLYIPWVTAWESSSQLSDLLYMTAVDRACC